MERPSSNVLRDSYEFARLADAGTVEDASSSLSIFSLPKLLDAALALSPPTRPVSCDAHGPPVFRHQAALTRARESRPARGDRTARTSAGSIRSRRTRRGSRASPSRFVAILFWGLASVSQVRALLLAGGFVPLANVCGGWTGLAVLRFPLLPQIVRFAALICRFLGVLVHVWPPEAIYEQDRYLRLSISHGLLPRYWQSFAHPA
jgi:hypothetical protein